MRSRRCTLMFFLLLALWITGTALAAPVGIKAFKKSLYPPEDALLTGVEPNVLFLLDVGSAMTFTPDGIMPFFENSFVTNPSASNILKIWPDMGKADYRAGLLKEATYGTGQRPHSRGTGNPAPNPDGTVNINLGSEYGFSSYSRYGRDTDPLNNIIGNPDCYYSPDPKKPYLLTFKNKTYAESPTLHPTLQARGFRVGQRAPSAYVDELVPNDSRMYKMKLVLWRLLGKDSAAMLSRMRIGMATSMQLVSYPYTMAGGYFDFYRVNPYMNLKPTQPQDRGSYYKQILDYYDLDLRPFGQNNSTDFVAYDVPTGKWKMTTFPHGTAPDWASGIREQMQAESTSTGTRLVSGVPYSVYRVISKYYSGSGGDYGGAQIAYAGIDRNFYASTVGSMNWLLANRAHLKLPFDILYKRQSDGTYKETENLYAFREYIDGVEQGDNLGGPHSYLSFTVSSEDYYRYHNMPFPPKAQVPLLPENRYGMLAPKAGGDTGSSLPPPPPPTGGGSYTHWNYTSYSYQTAYWVSGDLVNPELFADGKTPLATSIYARVKGAPYSHIDTSNKAKTAASYYLSTPIDPKNMRWEPNTWKSAYYAEPAINFGPLTGSSGTRDRFRYGYTGYLTARRYQNNEGLMAGSAVGSVIDFFSPRPEDLAFNSDPAKDTRGFFPVTGSCQSNWVVVFTAGNDDVPNYTPEAAVKALYQNSKQMRGRYWKKEESKWEEKNFAMEHGVRTMVVGFVEPPDPYDPDKPDEPNQVGDTPARVLRKTLYRMAREGYPNIDGTPNPKSVPYFANDVPQLLETLKAVLLRIYTDRFATGAPMIMPPVEADGKKVAFSGAYTVKELDQWDSYFYRSIILPSGQEDTTTRWEFNDKLAAMGLSRNLYTTLVAEGISSVPASKLIKNLTPADFSSYAGITNSSDVFARWLHVYDEGKVLGDIEHSGITIIGTPEAKSLLDDPSVASRDRVIYMQTNRGVLHAINFEDGQEVWGFFPPNIFQNRLKEMKFKDGSYLDGNGHMTLRSHPMVLLSGMMTARDVNSSTVLIGNLGWGGNGLYAMDVTNEIGSANKPHFLWAIDNARYGESTGDASNVKRWGKAAGGSLSNYDYSDLGLTIAASEILRLSDTQTVAVLPGGLGYDLGASDHGKILYVLNPENGQILQKFTPSAANVNLPLSRKLGMLIAPITYVEDENRHATEFYTSDTEGNLLYCDTTGPISSWVIKSLFRLENVDGSAEAIITPFSLLRAETSGGTPWVFGGTKDLMVPDHQAGVRELPNGQQFIWGLNMGIVNSEDKAITTTDLSSLVYFQDTLKPTYGTPFSNGSHPVEGGGAITKGWYLKLRPDASNDPQDPRKMEYVTTAPFMYYGVLYVATFLPRTRDSARLETCPELGDAKLYALDPQTGAGAWENGVQAIALNNIKISGISASDGRLYLAVKVLKDGAVEALPSSLKSTSLAYGTLLSIVSAKYGDGVLPTYTPNIPHIQYWREKF